MCNGDRSPSWVHANATDLFANSVKMAGKEPKVVKSDALVSYKRAAMPNAVHVSDAGINGKHIHIYVNPLAVIAMNVPSWFPICA